MIVVLLPSTNIYSPHYTPSRIENTKRIFSIDEKKCKECPPHFLLSQSMLYYLNKVQLKTEHIDYSYFKNIYNTNSNIVALSQSFFIFVELFQHFDIPFEAHNFGYFVKGGCVDWGIVQAIVPHYKSVGMDNSNHGLVATNNIYINAPTEIPIHSQFADIDINIDVNIISTMGNNEIQTDVNDVTILDYLPSSVSSSLEIINTRKIGSTLIMKIDNCFETGIIQLLYYLCSVYNKVFVAKPVSCWGGESTKYVVCKYFKGGNINVIDFVKPTHIFLTKIEELNCIFSEEQIDTLLIGINKPEKFNTIMKSYQQKCVNWFLKHNLPTKTIT